MTSLKIGDRVSAGRLLAFLEGFPTGQMYGSSSSMARDGMLAEYKVLPAEVRGSVLHRITQVSLLIARIVVGDAAGASDL